MAKVKLPLPLPTLLTLLVTAVALAAGATYIVKLGSGAELDPRGFVAKMDAIMLLAATVVFAASLLISRQLAELATKTETQRAFPPTGADALLDGIAPTCDGEPALMVAARLRGFALLLLCIGIAAALFSLLLFLRA